MSIFSNFFIILFVYVAQAELYCGEKNCYDVLDVERTATDKEIKRAYFKLSLRFHPDKNKTKGAEAKFIEISNAYEILKDTRGDYNDFLDNPDAYYRNHYRYYKHRYVRHTNPYFVVGGFVCFITIFHYVHWWYMYYKIRKYVARHPKVLQALKNKQKEKHKGLTKKQRKQKMEQESQDPIDIDSVVKLDGKQARPPSFSDLLIWHFFFCPLKLYAYMYWNIRWYVLFTRKKQPYDEDAKAYLTCQVFKISLKRWNTLEEMQRQDLLSKEIWIPQNFKEYKREYIANHKKKTSYRKKRR